MPFNKGDSLWGLWYHCVSVGCTDSQGILWKCRDRFSFYGCWGILKVVWGQVASLYLLVAIPDLGLYPNCNFLWSALHFPILCHCWTTSFLFCHQHAIPCVFKSHLNRSCYMLFPVLPGCFYYAFPCNTVFCNACLPPCILWSVYSPNFCWLAFFKKKLRYDLPTVTLFKILLASFDLYSSSVALNRTVFKLLKIHLGKTQFLFSFAYEISTLFFTLVTSS